jgi:hypothetical protein
MMKMWNIMYSNISLVFFPKVPYNMILNDEELI